MIPNPSRTVNATDLAQGGYGERLVPPHRDGEPRRQAREGNAMALGKA
jgi:hypothetical protein